MAEDAGHFTRTERHPVIRVLQGLNLCFGRIFHQVNIRSHCPLPRKGPAILICNHLSGLDPVLIQSACPRLIRWMMAKEYYQQRGLQWMFDQIGVIPVDRGNRDLAATRSAFRALAAGYVLGVFPEGMIETTSELLPFQSGIVLLAAKTGAAIYPAYLDGTQRGKEMMDAILHRNLATLSFGESFTLSREDGSRDHMDAATARVQAAVEKLRQAELHRPPTLK